MLVVPPTVSVVVGEVLDVTVVDGVLDATVVEELLDPTVVVIVTVPG